MALEKHTRSDDVGCGKAIIEPRMHTRSDDVWHARMAFRKHRWLDDVEHGVPLSPLDSTYGPMTLGVTCHHRHWATHAGGLRLASHVIGLGRALHDIMELGKHTRWDDVCHGNAIIIPGIHTRSDDIKCGMS
uniref:Uncharacterized protein n=1 Tax=Solanum lycopersicum TaxID=4081 RepID=A0A3Q7GT91_SOLLC